jgi:hypothetical protein
VNGRAIGSSWGRLVRRIKYGGDIVGALNRGLKDDAGEPEDVVRKVFPDRGKSSSKS